ncbi:MAG TPA: beta-propeller domain-containing protein, partial [Myxococcales bacterium]|nr:beta-propeller domain-containing protein [Myxococcales bacterium]
MLQKIFHSLLFAVLLVSACSKSASSPPGIQRRVALQAVSSCDELSSQVQEAAVRLMRAQLDSSKTIVAYGAPGGGSTNSAGGNSPTPAAPPASYSTTNTHVAGVDEADFMKNDGTRIFTLANGSLEVVKSWPPQDLSFAAKLPIEGWPTSMFLDGDTVVVLSSVWSMPTDSSVGVLPCPACPMGAMCPVCGGEPVTKVTIVDASDLAALKVTAEQYLPGYAVSSRRIDSSVRLVLSENMQWPAGVKWWVDWNPVFNTDHDAFVAAIDALEDANEKVIRATPAQSFFPAGKRKLSSGAVVDLSYRCTDFYVANAPERPGLLTVATLDLANPATDATRTSILGEPGIVYATAQHLYVATPHWWWQADNQQDFTYIHEFDISDPVRTSYLASGGVAGLILDEFALDEASGNLRVATTTRAWSKPTPTSSTVTVPWTTTLGNHVSVLAPQSSALAVVGDTGNLVPGEGIRGVRFVGNNGFVVTFRSVDPLVTIDLSDPANPRKVAELTIPGFSTYLQPIDEGHLLAIGTDLPAPDPVTGRVDWSKRAMQLSLFDVTDLQHPTRTAQLLVGTMNGWSEAAYDHHAFNWYAQRNLLAIPFSDWLQSGTSTNWYDQFVSDVRVFRVDASSGISPVGSLGMRDVYIQAGSGDWTYFYVPWVRRSVLATDQAGADYVYA